MQPYIRVRLTGSQPAGEVIEGTCLLHHAHGENHSHHEENHLNHTVLQHSRSTTLHHRIHVHELAIEDLVHDPEYAEHAQGAQERTQLGDVMEGRDKPQTADSHEEHQQSLPLVQAGIIATERHHNPFCLNSFRQHTLHQQGWNQPRCKTREE